MSNSDIEKTDQAGAQPLPDPKALRRALLKLDCIFLPVLTLVYWLNFLDVRRGFKIKLVDRVEASKIEENVFRGG